MQVSVRLSALADSHWYDYAIRFVLGGVMTVVAGVIAKYNGPVVGGLFLAFPAIFPASATLIEKHEREKKKRAGLPGARRGKEAGALEARGTALGSVGLMSFGALIWHTITINPWLAFLSACVTWLAVSALLWALCRNLRVTR
jgi:hypothetical protein